MRRQVLLSSASRRLPPGHQLVDAAYLWRRHPWAIGYGFAAALATGILAGVVGFETAPAIGLALAAAAVAGVATTRYRVLALTDQGIVSFGASPLRQAARGNATRLSAGEKVTLAGNYVIYTEWLIGEQRWSAPRSAEAAMSRMASWG